MSVAACAPFSALKTIPVTKTYAPRYFTWEEWIFLHAACARLIPREENGPGSAELGMPLFIDREMDGAFGHAVNWHMQRPFVPAPPEFGYQSARDFGVSFQELEPVFDQLERAMERALA